MDEASEHPPRRCFGAATVVSERRPATSVSKLPAPDAVPRSTPVSTAPSSTPRRASSASNRSRSESPARSRKTNASSTDPKSPWSGKATPAGRRRPPARRRSTPSSTSALPGQVPLPTNETDEDVLALALCYAAKFGHLEIADTLLASGADVNGQAPFDHAATPLHWAVLGDQPACIRWLLERGASDAARLGRAPRAAGQRPSRNQSL